MTSPGSRFQSHSQGKLTTFAWKAPIPAWAALILSHLSLLLAITRKTQWQSSCATSSQSWNSLWKALGWILWAGTLPWAQECRKHNHRESGQSHTQGAKLGVRDKPGAGEATPTLRVSCPSWCLSCPSWCPGHPHRLTQPVWDAGQGWMSPAGPGAAAESPELCAPAHPPALLTLSWQHSLSLCQHPLHHNTSSSSLPLEQTLHKHLWQSQCYRSWNHQLPQTPRQPNLLQYF